MKWTLEDEAAMEALGRELASSLMPGSVLALVGGLGAGKTHLAKGLAAGMGFEGEVTSPTFALVQEYRGGRLPVFHFDFYRLETPQALLEIGWDDFLDEEGVVIAEWADHFPDLMPEGTRWLKLKLLPEGGRLVVEG